MVPLADRLRTELPSAANQERTTVLLRDHARITASSAGLGWQGLQLEVGTVFGCDVDEQMVDGHFVGIQLNDAPLVIGTRTAGRWSDTIMPPHSLWIHPEGTPFALQHSAFSRWAAAVIDGAFLDSVMGQHYELRASYVVEDELLSHLLRALIGQISNSDPQIVRDTVMTNSLINGFVRALGRGHGMPAAPMPHGGGIAPGRIKALRAWLDENLGGDLNVEAMAEYVGLSAAHFAREFKRSTGMTPWSYVVELRLNQARRLLLGGEAAGNVARKCGFADQSHLGRAMKARFDVSPREIASGSTGRAANEAMPEDKR